MAATPTVADSSRHAAAEFWLGPGASAAPPDGPSAAAGPLAGPLALSSSSGAGGEKTLPGDEAGPEEVEPAGVLAEASGEPAEGDGDVVGLPGPAAEGVGDEAAGAVAGEADLGVGAGAVEGAGEGEVEGDIFGAAGDEAGVADEPGAWAGEWVEALAAVGDEAGAACGDEPGAAWGEEALALAAEGDEAGALAVALGAWAETKPAATARRMKARGMRS